ncbi:hypothetical protein BC628DRAFT_1337259 [Trametes gibbosa]|nr:hypothetical protein BC628DRAFT_1337259 [Trametes gibbosa]
MLQGQIADMQSEWANVAAPLHPQPASGTWEPPCTVTFETEVASVWGSASHWGLTGPSQEDAVATSHSLLPSAQVDPNSYLGCMFGLSEVVGVRSSTSVLARGGSALSMRAPQGLPEIQKRLMLKLREPTVYSGKANLQVFQKFALEAKNFLKGYHVEANEHIMRISYYLTRRTWDFYLNAVMDEHEASEISRLLQVLFDYCFPVDHCQ